MPGGFVSEHVEIWAPQVADLLEALGAVAFVAGGAARQLVMLTAPAAEDVDLFVRSRAAFETCEKGLIDLGYQVVGASPFAVTFAARNWRLELPVQLIRPYEDTWTKTYGTPEEVLSHFAFTTEKFAVCAGGEAIVGETARRDTSERRLVLQQITNPLWVALRATKYAAKGYQIDLSEMRRVLDAWVDRPQQRELVRGE
jgi:hypothetical protein